MMAWRPVDPLDPEQQPCPAAKGQLHSLVVAGPRWHRVMRCAFCGLSERTLRAELKGATR
jgi:hypothetical protein